MQFPISKNKNGFTLLETLIAIAILSVAVAASFGVAQKALMSSAFSKNQTSAFFLASEGLEMVRAVRDNVGMYNAEHLSAPVDWLKPFKDVCGASINTCTFDIDPTASYKLDASGSIGGSVIRTCNTANATTDCYLKVVSNSGETYYSSIPSFASTIFVRHITIEEKCYTDWNATTVAANCTTASAKKEATITATVKWLGEQYSVKEVLSNWQSLE